MNYTKALINHAIWLVIVGLAVAGVVIIARNAFPVLKENPIVLVIFMGLAFYRARKFTIARNH